MIDRKFGDKPITFEVSVGKCVKSLSKERGSLRSKGMIGVTDWYVSGLRNQLQSRAYILFKPWLPFLWITVNLGVLMPVCLTPQVSVLMQIISPNMNSNLASIYPFNRLGDQTQIIYFRQSSFCDVHLKLVPGCEGALCGGMIPVHCLGQPHWITCGSVSVAGGWQPRLKWQAPLCPNILLLSPFLFQGKQDHSPWALHCGAKLSLEAD